MGKYKRQWLERERLLQSLNQHDPVVWVCGPAGAGKTVLIESWIYKESHTALWCHLSHELDNVRGFCQYLLEVARFKIGLPEHLDNNSGLQRFFTQFFAALDNECVLVFDQYLSSFSSQFHTCFALMLKLAPADKRVLVLSRAVPPAQFARLRMYGILRLLHWDALRFTLAESDALLRMHGDFAEWQLQEWHQQSNGWAAGLLLMQRVQQTFDRRELFDYFTHEVFAQVDTDTQNFLLHTCFLPELTVQLASQLSGVDQSEKMLRFLSEHHCFTEACGMGRYIYHPLFADFLQIKAKNAFPVSASPLRASVKTLAETKRIQDAINLLLHNADSLAMAELLLTLSSEITLIFPTDSAWQHYWQGRVTANLGYLHLAWQQFALKNELYGQLLCWVSIVERYLQLRQYVALDEWIDWLAAQDEANLSSKELTMRIAQAMATALIYRCPYHEQLAQWLQRAPHLGEPLQVLQMWQGQNLAVNNTAEQVFISPQLYPESEQYGDYLSAWHSLQQGRENALALAQLSLQHALASGYYFVIMACQLLVKQAGQMVEVLPYTQLSPAMHIRHSLLNTHWNVPLTICYLREHLLPVYDLPVQLLSEFCAEALTQNIEIAFVQQLICQRQLKPAKHIRNWPYPIRIQLLKKNVTIYRYGKQVDFGRRPPFKALRMLRLIIEHGGECVKGSLIADSLWDDYEGDKAHYSFKFTLHRLRELLGGPESILCQDGSLSINKRMCWIDEL